MNERIQELYTQAIEYAASRVPAEHRYNDNYYAIAAIAATKHAELIVQRTLAIVEAHTEIFQSDEARAMVEHIKRSVKTDFGVEE